MATKKVQAKKYKLKKKAVQTDQALYETPFSGARVGGPSLAQAIAGVMAEMNDGAEIEISIDTLYFVWKMERNGKPKQDAAKVKQFLASIPGAMSRSNGRATVHFRPKFVVAPKVEAKPVTTGKKLKLKKKAAPKATAKKKAVKK